MADGFFFELSPERVLEAVEAAAVRTTGRCLTLNALENRVFDVELDGDPPRHVVAKFYRPQRWTREQILDEHRLLEALVAHEIPACAPLRFPDGGTLHQIEGIQYALWPRVGGRAPDELGDEEIAVLGRLLARIHNVAAATGAPHRGRLDASALRQSLARLEASARLPASGVARYRVAVERVADLYEDRARHSELHPIHGDCHMGNLLRRDDGWQILDFDDLVIGPAVHDVWMLLPGRDAEAQRQRHLLVESYRDFRPFDDSAWRLVEPLRAFRFVSYAAWIASRWDDPAFPATFPHFGTEAYWQRETADLEDLIEQIARD